MRLLKWLGLGCLGLLVVLVVAVGIALQSTQGRALADAVSQIIDSDELQGDGLNTAEDMLAYLVAHPDRYALALWDVGQEDAGVFWGADTTWPLASTVKVIPLALASEHVAAGTWQEDEAMSELKWFYLPGTDGEAHEKATAAFDGGVQTLGQALTAMIRFSDNAATDALLFRLGREPTRERLSSWNDPGLPVPHPIAGTMLLGIERYDGGTIDDAAWERARQLRDDGASGDELRLQLKKAGLGLTVSEQAEMTKRFDNSGSPRAFARLMERVFDGERPEYAVARSRLDWPMAFASNQDDFVHLGTKGGSLPGVLTSASYAETKSGQRRVLALFLHDLPFATWVALLRSFAQQKLERQLLLDPNALSVLRARLAEGPSDAGFRGD